MNPKTFEAERGKYKVRAVGNKVVVEAKKDDSPYYVPQSIFIENISDLKDLFIAIASVLNQIYGTDQFN
jgi:hypothetical protein